MSVFFVIHLDVSVSHDCPISILPELPDTASTSCAFAYNWRAALASGALKCPVNTYETSHKLVGS